MRQMEFGRMGRAGTTIGVLVLALVSCSMMTGCLVMGTTSRGGFFIWPGSIGLLVLLLILFLVMRRR
ncbi:hypothetical protein HDF10_004129 [Edaphobacter lichenicola]|uniref:Uncharacterized protein n=1 Tax=Tunturiibacter lichenicola TaxID=2051959 RepID=A0A7W8JBB5_9BACT|nr:hypothetical protein [Edaphobacter lichenicola]